MHGVAAQIPSFDEVWVYDDCSADDTSEVARKLGANVVRGDRNRGCSYGKNALARLTECDWLHFHDADDEILPGFVERAHRWMASDAWDVIAFGCEQRSEATGELEDTSIHDAPKLAQDPIGYTIETKINANCGLYRRTAFLAAGGFDTDPDVLYNEDVAMHCSLARAGLRFTADPDVFMTYWRRESSMSNANRAKCFRAEYTVLLKARSHDPAGRYCSQIAKRLWAVATASACYLDWDTADAAARLAFQIAGPPEAQSRVFRALFLAGPTYPLKVREWLIRLVKPKYRVGYPGWRRR
jgi:glycosyltransferase involved in cell wall biosynthesis